MARRLVIEPEAEADIAGAFSWYEEQRAGLGEEFLHSLDEAHAKVLERPQMFPVKFDGFRRVLVRRFPYAVWLESSETTVVVYAVFHCARDPASLVRRLKGLPD